MKTKIQILFFLFLCSIAYSQKVNKEMTILKTWKIKNAKDYLVKTNFSFTEKGKTKYFYLETTKNAVVLKDAKTKKVIEKYPFRIPSPNISCEEQEQEQMDYYAKNIYPLLLKTANTNCSTGRYCLQINCNGTPTKAIMFLIFPTRFKCKWTNATLKAEIKKYDFSLAVGRY